MRHCFWPECIFSWSGCVECAGFILSEAILFLAAAIASTSVVRVAACSSSLETQGLLPVGVRKTRFRDLISKAIVVECRSRLFEDNRPDSARSLCWIFYVQICQC